MKYKVKKLEWRTGYNDCARSGLLSLDYFIEKCREDKYCLSDGDHRVKWSDHVEELQDYAQYLHQSEIDDIIDNYVEFENES